MERPSPLFRREAVEARGTRTEGTIILHRPSVHQWIAVCAMLTIVALLFALHRIQYAAKVAVTGFVVPEGGLIKIFPSHTGIV